MRRGRRNRADVRDTMIEVDRMTRAGYVASVVAYRLGVSRRTVERYKVRIRTADWEVV